MSWVCCAEHNGSALEFCLTGEAGSKTSGARAEEPPRESWLVLDAAEESSTEVGQPRQGGSACGGPSGCCWSRAQGGWRGPGEG